MPYYTVAFHTIAPNSTLHHTILDHPIIGERDITRAKALGKYHHFKKYLSESPSLRVYKLYIIPKIKNFRTNKLLSSSN